MTIKLIGHRGNGRTTATPFAEGKAPEHTLRSFEEAIANGAEGVEFDVFLTRDRVPVVIDRNLALKNYETIRETDYADVNLHLPNNRTEAIPSLEETLCLLQDLNDQRAVGVDPLFINIELKGPGTAEPTLTLVDGINRQYGLNVDSIYYSATDWDKLALIRALDKDANIQPTILSKELFPPRFLHPVGFYASDNTPYDPAALKKFSKFIKDKGCCAIDTPTGDIREELINMADSLNVGFCTHPSGPRLRIEAPRLYKTVGLLKDFAQATGNYVTMKVDDIKAASTVVNSVGARKSTPISAMERMMGSYFITPSQRAKPWNFG